MRIGRLTPATGWDIQFILRQLSAQNEAEREIIGLSMAEAIAHLTSLLDKGPSETTMVEGRPAAAFGIVIDDESPFHNTWFIATRAAFASGVAGLRYSRTRVAYYRKRFGKPLRSISFSPLPEAPRWFKMLGFDEETGPGVDGARVFIYR
jgi:hypothetical protein